MRAAARAWAGARLGTVVLAPPGILRCDSRRFQIRDLRKQKRNSSEYETAPRGYATTRENRDDITGRPEATRRGAVLPGCSPLVNIFGHADCVGANPNRRRKPTDLAAETKRDAAAYRTTQARRITHPQVTKSTRLLVWRL